MSRDGEHFQVKKIVGVSLARRTVALGKCVVTEDSGVIAWAGPYKGQGLRPDIATPWGLVSVLVTLLGPSWDIPTAWSGRQRRGGAEGV